MFRYSDENVRRPARPVHLSFSHSPRYHMRDRLLQRGVNYAGDTDAAPIVIDSIDRVVSLQPSPRCGLPAMSKHARNSPPSLLPVIDILLSSISLHSHEYFHGSGDFSLKYPEINDGIKLQLDYRLFTGQRRIDIEIKDPNRIPRIGERKKLHVYSYPFTSLIWIINIILCIFSAKKCA